MSKLPKLKFDSDLESHTCRHQLGRTKVKIYIDASEERVDLATLTKSAQAICDDWPDRHNRLCRIVAKELLSTGRLGKNKKTLEPKDCVPFSLRVAADSDGEISYAIGFNVDSVLDDDEYVEVEEEINGSWTNSEVGCTE
jgi:hypothetical protein